VARHAVEGLDLPAISLGRAHVQHRHLADPQTGEYRVGIGEPIGRPRPGLDGDGLPRRRGPRLDRPSPRAQGAIEERTRSARPFEHPPQPSRERSARVVVGHDRAIAADPPGTECARERLGIRQRVSAGSGHRVARKVPIDVEEHRAGDVPSFEVPDRRGGAPRRGPTHIDEIDFLSVLREPAGVDEQRHRSVTITGA
jgi:hypothetical protein